MTPRQHQILNFIRDYIVENGFAPSYREMAEGLQIVSRSNLHGTVSALVAQGYLVRGARNGRRRIYLPGAAPGQLTQTLSGFPTSALKAELKRRGVK
jgi:SOS-response transcriptional repressor LexA